MLFQMRIPVVDRESLGVALRCLQYQNLRWLRDNPDAPHPYDAGVRYMPELPGRESWDIVPVIYARGWGDCEDLAGAVAAFHVFDGTDPDARAVAYRSGPRTWHAVVRRGDGSIEDPSLALGMRLHRGIRAPGSRYR